MRSLLPLILVASLAGSTAARASAAQASELHVDAVRVDASSAALGTVEVVIGALALTASALVAMVEHPAAGLHDDPRPCDQW